MSIWQTMMRISEAQIAEIQASPKLLDAFLYMAGMRSSSEYVADIQEQGTHDIVQTATGFMMTVSKNSGARITPPAIPWYRRLWNALKPSRPLIKRPVPPAIPPHWPPLECPDQCGLDQDFDLVFYLFSDCELPGTYPLNFMLFPRHSIGGPEYENGLFYLSAMEVNEVLTAMNAISQETLKQRFANTERLAALGCRQTGEWAGMKYEEVIGGMIDEMLRFLRHVQSKGDGILISLG